MNNKNKICKSYIWNHENHKPFFKCQSLQEQLSGGIKTLKQTYLNTKSFT